MITRNLPSYRSGLHCSVFDGQHSRNSAILVKANEILTIFNIRLFYLICYAPYIVNYARVKSSGFSRKNIWVRLSISQRFWNCCATLTLVQGNNLVTLQKFSTSDIQYRAIMVSRQNSIEGFVFFLLSFACVDGYLININGGLLTT